MERKPLSSSLNISCEYVPHLYIHLLIWFISLPQFLYHLNNDLEWWNNCISRRLISQLLSHHKKNLKQQTSYSSVRAQADRTFIKQTTDITSQNMGTGWLQRSGNDPSWLSFLYFPSPPCCCCCPVTKFCLSICDSMYSCTSGFPVLHCLPEFVQTHVHWVGDAIQLSDPLSSLSPPALSHTCHQSGKGIKMGVCSRPISEGGVSGYMKNRTFSYSSRLAWTENFDWQMQVT